MGVGGVARQSLAHCLFSGRTCTRIKTQGVCVWRERVMGGWRAGGGEGREVLG
jgi:hypothetical protein